MNEIINLKCPHCGKIVPVRNMPELEKKKLLCPVCKNKTPIAECERVKVMNDDETQYNTGNQKAGDDHTTLGENHVVSIGRLREIQTGHTYPLRLGRNTIGRRVATPLPTVTLAIEESQTHNTMSREHAIIEVTRLADGSYRHFLCNWKGKNGTYLNGTLLAQGDRIVLSDRQTIRLGKVELYFETN